MFCKWTKSVSHRGGEIHSTIHWVGGNSSSAAAPETKTQILPPPPPLLLLCALTPFHIWTESEKLKIEGHRLIGASETQTFPSRWARKPETPRISSPRMWTGRIYCIVPRCLFSRGPIPGPGPRQGWRASLFVGSAGGQGPESFHPLTLWLAYKLAECVIPCEDFPWFHLFKKEKCYNSPADNPVNRIKRRESGRSSAWFERVQRR